MQYHWDMYLYTSSYYLILSQIMREFYDERLEDIHHNKGVNCHWWYH